MSRILFPIATALLLGVACFVPQPASAAPPATATHSAMPAKVVPAKTAVPAKAIAAKASPATTRCHDAAGKFTKCATAKAQPKRCRDDKGKFAKCAA